MDVRNDTSTGDGSLQIVIKLACCFLDMMKSRSGLFEESCKQQIGWTFKLHPQTHKHSEVASLVLVKLLPTNGSARSGSRLLVP